MSVSELRLLLSQLWFIGGMIISGLGGSLFAALGCLFIGLFIGYYKKEKK